MTSFAYPPIMAPNHFDPYATGDDYSTYPAPDQSYPPQTMSTWEAPNLDALSPIESFPGMDAFVEAPASRPSYPYGLEAPAHNLKNYSSSASPAEHLQPPHLSTSSESGASVHSTASSAMGSPHMHPQFPPQEHWNPMVSNQGLELSGGMHQEHFNHEGYFPTPMDQEVINMSISNDKLAGFVGESQSSLPSPGLSSARRFPSAPLSPSSLPTGILAGLPMPGVSLLRSQTMESAQYMAGRPSDAVFKTPTLPASALQPLSPLQPSPPRSPYFDQRRHFPSSPDLSRQRRSSLLSHQVYPPMITSSPRISQSPEPFISPRTVRTGYATSLDASCSFSSPISSHLLSRTRRQETFAEGWMLTSTLPTDPNMILPNAFSPLPYFTEIPQPSPRFSEYPGSPAPSSASRHGKAKVSPSQSPYPRQHPYHPYSMPPIDRRLSTSSGHSAQSSQRSGSFDVDGEPREKGLCTWPDCGRVFKDLKAHMLTHEAERPEKCPILNCEYHTKGFARKYDKNRHTLTHYKGTMVCGFCPGSGSATENSFNRADVFKRHLTTCHGVEQAPPNSRKKGASGKKTTTMPGQSTSAACSTCGKQYANVQEFYEHLDECVLRIVQQVEPSEAINQQHLSAISESQEVQDTLERHGLSNSTDYTAPEYDEDDDDAEEEEDNDMDDGADSTYGQTQPRSSKKALKSKRNTS